ncbi:MAG: translocation/assembly module TamB domain-containing protein [Candidatus Zixiibacteriota bacterium]
MAAAIVFALVSLSLLLLSLPPGERFIKGMAEGKLSDLLGQQVRIGDLETNLLSRLEVRDLRIFQVGPRDTIPLLNLGHARIRYRLADLFRRPLSIHSVSLDDLFLSVSRDSSGAYNIPLFASDEKGDTVSTQAPLQVQLNRAVLRNASIRYLDSSIPMGASVHNLNVTVEHGINQTYLYHLQADSSVLEYRSVPLTAAAIELKGQLSPQGLELNSLSIGLPGLEFTGNAKLLQESDPPSVTGDFSLKGNPGALLQTASRVIDTELPPVQGDVDLALRLDGSLDHPRLSFQLDLPGLDVAEIRIVDGSIQAELEPGSVSLNQMNLGVLGGSISGKGRLVTDSLLSGQLSISVSGVDLAQVWQYVYGEASPYQGRIHGQLTASGSSRDPKNWNVLTDLSLKQAKYRSKSIPDFSAKLSIQQGLADFRFNQENSELLARLKLDGEQLQGEFSARIFQLEPLAGLADVSELTGSMELQGVLGGNVDSPSISAQVKTNNLRYQNFPVDSLFANILYRDGQAHISELHFAGNLDPIDPLRPPFHLSDLSGAVAYRGKVSGRPDSLSGQISIELTRPGYGDIHFDEGRLQATLEGQRMNLSLLQLRRDSLLIQVLGDFSMLSASGSCEIELIRLLHDGLSLENGEPILVPEADDTTAGFNRAGKLTAAFDVSKADRYTLAAEGDRLNLETIRNLLPEPPDMGGWLGFNLAFAGNTDNPEVDFDFHLQRPRFQLVEMDSVKGHLAFAGDQFIFRPLELYHEGHHSTAEGFVGLKRGQHGAWSVTEHSPVRGEASGQGFDLRLLNAFLPEDMRVSGYGSYNLSWDGTLRHPHPAGTLVLEDGAVQTAQNAPAIEKISLNSSIQDSVLSIVNLSGEIQDTPFQLQGNLTVSQLRKFDVKMSLSIADFGSITGDGTLSSDSLQFRARVNQMDLATLQPFFPDLAQLSGILNTEVALSGSTQDPEVDGHLEVRGLTVQPAWLNVPLDQGVVKLEFNRNEFKIDSVFVRLEQGTIFVSGNLTHDEGELVHADVRVKVSDVKIDRPKELILSVKSAQLSYKDQNSYFLLDGDIILGESRMLVNFRPQSVLPFAQAVEKPKPELPSFLQRTRMNVRLRESEEIWVDNNLARLRLHTELGVIGSPAQPNLTGRVTVEEGYVLYLDRKFRIKRGIVDFIDPNRLNPIIDLRAETTVKTYRATEAVPYLIAFTLTGPLDEVVVDLSSDPPEDKSNIISLLTIGATREELVGKDAEGKGASSALLERAQSLSSQRIAGYTSDKVGSLLGLDQFTIEGNLFSRDRTSGPQLLASKKISPRVELTYTTTVGHSNENSFRLDYRLSKHFFLEGQTDQQGRAGMNLKYRLRSR